MTTFIAADKLPTDDFKIIEPLRAQLDQKIPRNIKRNNYYDAKQNVEHLGIAVPPHLQDLGTVLGWPEKAVSDLEERIDLEGFVFADGTDWKDVGLDEVYRSNDLALQSSQSHTSALKYAVTFLSVLKGDQSLGEPEIVVRPLTALGATASWDQRHRRVDTALSVTKTSNGFVHEFVLFTPLSVDTYSWTGKKWDVNRSSHELGRAPVSFLPFKPSIERPFGRSRISRPVMSITDRGIRTLTRLEITAEFFSAPQRILLGADEDQFEDENGESVSAWDSLIGRYNAIPRNEDGELPNIWQAPQTSMQPHLEVLRSDALAFAGETGVSPSSLGIAYDNPESDAAMKTAYLKLIKTAERCHVSFGSGWTDAMRLAAEQMGISDQKLLGGLQAQFRPAETATMAEQSDAIVKQAAVMPWLAESEVTLERLGYSKTEIERLVADKSRAEAKAMLAQVLGDGDSNSSE